MPEINYQQFKKYISNLKPEEFVPVYLVYGDEFLFTSVLKALSQKLLMGESVSMGYEAIEGDAPGTVEALSRVGTFNLLSSRKVVALCNSRVFHEKNNADTLLENARQAFLDKDLKKAAKIYLDYMAIFGLQFEDLENKVPSPSNHATAKVSDDENWADAVRGYCIEHHLAIPSVASQMERVQAAVEKGFPERNHLIITAEVIDKRRQLYKTIREKGMVIDCSVPTGDRKADKDAQALVLKEQLKMILSKYDKTINPDAFSALCEMTGFDLRTFKGNIEKLVDYAGARQCITVEDVGQLLVRTKTDPIYEINNAIADRNCEKSLSLAHFLISGGMHPLAILSAIINQIRKLLICRSLIDDLRPKGWHEKMTYPQFTKDMMPLVVAYDKSFLFEVQKWEEMLQHHHPDGATKKAKGRQSSAKSDSDLVIAKNPANAYPVYQMMQKSASFSMDELTDALSALYDGDMRLKSSSQNPKLVLEKTIMAVCMPKQEGQRAI